MTADGYTKFQNELNNFVNKQRPEITAAIAEARDHGDLSENAEYQSAKEQQSLIEGKILDELELHKYCCRRMMLGNVHIISYLY